MADILWVVEKLLKCQQSQGGGDTLGFPPLQLSAVTASVAIFTAPQLTCVVKWYHSSCYGFSCHTRLEVRARVMLKCSYQLKSEDGLYFSPSLQSDYIGDLLSKC